MALSVNHSPIYRKRRPIQPGRNQRAQILGEVLIKLFQINKNTLKSKLSRESKKLSSVEDVTAYIVENKERLVS